MSGPTDLYDLANSYLTVCVDALNTIPTYAPALAGAPGRTYVSPGQPAFDCCDQVAVDAALVNAEATQPGGLAAGKRFETGQIPNVTLLAYVTRCLNLDDLPDPPTVAHLTADARQHDADGWALWNNVFNRQMAGLWLPRCKSIFFDGIRSITPQGGCGGWVVTVRARLDGYQEVIST